jgi:2-dehydro-3-deoxyphosphogluconate aldolase / (4S)-4-hydroxy-2-oxoglutarate aldolase
MRAPAGVRLNLIEAEFKWRRSREKGVHNLFRGVAVIPVLTIEREQHAVPLARALLDGGLPLLEATLRTPTALAAIARALPQVVVGAGTVQRPAAVVHAGARFLVSPEITPKLAAAALATELPYLPEVATRSEVTPARDLGIRFLKLFPAEAIAGLALSQALAPVFPGSHSAQPAASTRPPQPDTWHAQCIDVSAGHGWRPGRRWPSMTG